MPRSLPAWLAFVEGIASRPIDLGLERTREVLARLEVPAARPVIITVGGTNGKGSTCAMLERILQCAGYRTALYTSPHLLRYNERVRVAGQEVTDDQLVAAFEQVESARQGTPLTYFEFGTLAAWTVFAAAAPDVVILEVGLGGRLDAVNVFDADCAVLTSIDLDHMEYLGPTRERIGAEKAGIFRPGRPAVCADADTPRSVVAQAAAIGTPLRLMGRDFGFAAERTQWQYWSRDAGGAVRRAVYGYPALRGAHQLGNASAVLAALECLRERVPVAMQDIRRGFAEVALAGRFHVLPGRPAVVLDVAHNPHAAAVLATSLLDMGYFQHTRAVFGMLADKDIAGVVAHMAKRVDEWYVTDLPAPRGAAAAQLDAVVAAQGGTVAGRFRSPREAFRAAREGAGDDDRIIIFGSFLTVADVMEELSCKNPDG